MEDKIIFALIGGIIGLVTAIVTSWLNKRAFREEIAESDILNTQLEDYKCIWEILTKINFDSTQLLASMVTQISKMQKEGIPNDQILLQINKEFEPKSIDILKTVMSLKRYYITIPVSLIESLKRYENLIWKVFKQQKFDRSNELGEVSEEVFRSIREITSKLIRREIKISDSVGGLPKGGYLPEYFKEALK